TCKIKYYVDLQHVTVLVDGAEVDITLPQHTRKFDGSKSEEVVVIPLSDIETFVKNDPYGTALRFERFVIAVARILRKRKARRGR
ncbi:hypothetical protein COU36_04675, partial [Candidatus Micrarchaeota archaeon CG10_big_fil_rev_8_21_14_0_10_59_7]